MSDYADRQRFKENLQLVRARTPMFFSRFSYRVLVGYVDGWDFASDQKLLEGFNDWMGYRLLGRKTPTDWSDEIFNAALPPESQWAARSPELRGDERIAINLLFDLLDEFLGLPDQGDS